MIVLAQVSDTHIDLGERNTERTRRVAAYLDAIPGRIDAVVVSGDIADHGAVAEYELARQLLPSRHPVYLMPGNHDSRDALRRVLLGSEGTGPINQIHQVGELTLLLVDSSVPGQSWGALTDETYAWLADALAAGSGPVMVFLHHPPVRLFSPLVDPIRLVGDEQFADLLAGSGRVVGVACGHAHTPATTVFAGVPLVIGPSVASILAPQWETRECPMVDYTSPPALAFHVVDDTGRLTTHFRTVSKRFTENAFDPALAPRS
ncbi:metallophosphoesterase [Skermania piniformis]|uniref:Metallophosphoesterase n=1 Tax=Skermania pinensis TaxID=39122 RepID=A0ABX8S774_9ACTN|nr:metallophosphoesterase [Skermania piniformis]QXQ13116.1 metallophosphoesterase [Skermania piniformis]